MPPLTLPVLRGPDGSLSNQRQAHTSTTSHLGGCAVPFGAGQHSPPADTKSLSQHEPKKAHLSSGCPLASGYFRTRH